MWLNSMEVEAELYFWIKFDKFHGSNLAGAISESNGRAEIIEIIKNAWLVTIIIINCYRREAQRELSLSRDALVHQQIFNAVTALN